MTSDFAKDLIEGDDVSIVIGVIKTGETTYAGIIIDYKTLSNDELRKSYTDFIEKMWQENALEKGFKLTRVNDNEFFLESKRRVYVAELQRGNVDQVNAPYYNASLTIEKDVIDAFYSQYNKSGVWVLHIRTELHSYLYVVDVNGNIVMKKKKDKPDELVE